MKWEEIPREEQETIINVDYCDKTISFYTTRQSVANRLLRKIGEPDKQDTTNGKICAVEYKRNLYDKDLAKFFSKALLIGSFKEGK